MTNHSHNLIGGGVIPNYSLADRVLVGKELAGEDVIDDDNPPRMLIILIRKESPAEKRDLESLEVSRFDDIVDGPTFVIFVRWFGLTFNIERLLVVAGKRDSAPGLRNRFHAPNRHDLGVKIAKGSTN